jgi:hypothetical protein
MNESIQPLSHLKYQHGSSREKAIGLTREDIDELRSTRHESITCALASPPEQTNRQVHEAAAGMGLCDEFFKVSGINPDAPATALASPPQIAQPSRCHICKQVTDLCCSDCAIDLGAKVYVCWRYECRNNHEMKCPGRALGTSGSTRQESTSVSTSKVENVTGAYHRAALAAAPPQPHSDDWWWEIIDAAIGQWGGQQRQHFAEAISRIKDVFNKRIAGLDEFGDPLKAEATPAAVEGPVFKRGQKVRVDSPQFHGFGIVQHDTGEPRTRYVSVMIENGNVRAYEYETVQDAEAYASSSRATKPK